MMGVKGVTLEVGARDGRWIILAGTPFRLKRFLGTITGKGEASSRRELLVLGHLACVRMS